MRPASAGQSPPRTTRDAARPLVRAGSPGWADSLKAPGSARAGFRGHVDQSDRRAGGDQLISPAARPDWGPRVGGMAESPGNPRALDPCVMGRAAPRRVAGRRAGQPDGLAGASAAEEGRQREAEGDEGDRGGLGHAAGGDRHARGVGVDGDVDAGGHQLAGGHGQGQRQGAGGGRVGAVGEAEVGGEARHELAGEPGGDELVEAADDRLELGLGGRRRAGERPAEEDLPEPSSRTMLPPGPKNMSPRQSVETRLPVVKTSEVPGVARLVGDPAGAAEDVARSRPWTVPLTDACRC